MEHLAKGVINLGRVFGREARASAGRIVAKFKITANIVIVPLGHVHAINGTACQIENVPLAYAELLSVIKGIKAGALDDVNERIAVSAVDKERFCVGAVISLDHKGKPMDIKLLLDNIGLVHTSPPKLSILYHKKHEFSIKNTFFVSKCANILFWYFTEKAVYDILIKNKPQEDRYAGVS
jgi:hypothetical protein